MLKIIPAVCSMLFFVSTISTGHTQSLSNRDMAAILLGTAVIAGVVSSQRRHRHQPHHYVPQHYQPQYYGHQPQYYVPQYYGHQRHHYVPHQNHRRHLPNQPHHNRGHRH